MRRHALEARENPLGMFVDTVTGFVGIMFIVVVVLMLAIRPPGDLRPPNPLRIPAFEPPPVGIGVPYQCAVPAQGGFGDKRFACPPDALPKGLQLDPKTGIVSGVPEPVSFPTAPPPGFGPPAGAVGSAARGLLFGAAPVPVAHPVRFTVTDDRGATASAEVALVVRPYVVPVQADDLRVRLLRTDAQLAFARAGVPYADVIGARGGLGRVAWSAGPGAPDWLRVEDGRVVGTPPKPGAFGVRVRGEMPRGATSAAGRALEWPGGWDERDFSVRVLPPLAAVKLLPARAGEPWLAPLFDAALLPAEALTVEALPDGLAPHPAGFVAGVPTRAGAHALKYRVAAGGTDVLTGTAELRVYPPRPAPEAPNLLLTARVGDEVSVAVPYRGLIEPVTVSAERPLPAGLVWDGLRLKGRPTREGTGTVPFALTDAAGTQLRATLAHRVWPAKEPFRIAVADALDLQVGVPFSWTVPTTGGETLGAVAPVSADGDLPPGCKLEGGALSGVVPAPGKWALTLVATDPASGERVERAVTVRAAWGVTDPLRVATDRLPPALAGDEYRVALSATGAAGAVTWRVEGELPKGLELKSGALTGRVADAGTYRFAVAATDAAGRTTGPQPLELVAERPERTAPAVVTRGLPRATPGEAYDVRLAAEGGLGGYRWELDGPLPAGVRFDAGALTGTPLLSGAGEWPVKVRATDERGTKSAERELRLVVAAPDAAKPLQVLTRALPKGIVGTEYNVALAATGTAAEVTWTAAGLPVGLRLDGGRISGTPTAAAVFKCTLSCKDAAGRTAGPVEVPLEVVQVERRAPEPLRVLLPALPTATAGAPYEAVLAVGGTGDPVTWTVTGLPPGLAHESGRVRGTPSAPGRHQLTVSVADRAGRKSVPVEVPLSVAGPAEPKAAPGAPAPGPLPWVLGAGGLLVGGLGGWLLRRPRAAPDPTEAADPEVDPVESDLFDDDVAEELDDDSDDPPLRR